jgi:hypothetical protein
MATPFPIQESCPLRFKGEMAGEMAALHPGSGSAGVSRPTRAAWQPHCQNFRHNVKFGSAAVGNHCHDGSASGARFDADLPATTGQIQSCGTGHANPPWPAGAGRRLAMNRARLYRWQ